MIVVSHRIGECFKIGKEVEITLLSIQGRQVRLGIEAPRSISIHRWEIYKKIAANSES